MQGFLTAYDFAIPQWKVMTKIKGTSLASGFLYDEFQRPAASEILFLFKRVLTALICGLSWDPLIFRECLGYLN